jgi:hypothetical protein
LKAGKSSQWEIRNEGDSVLTGFINQGIVGSIRHVVEILDAHDFADSSALGELRPCTLKAATQVLDDIGVFLAERLRDAGVKTRKPTDWIS